MAKGKGGGGVSQKMTIADEGGMGVMKMMIEMTKSSPGCAKKMMAGMMRPKTFMLQSFDNLQKYFSKSAKELGTY